MGGWYAAVLFEQADVKKLIVRWQRQGRILSETINGHI